MTDGIGRIDSGKNYYEMYMGFKNKEAEKENEEKPTIQHVEETPVEPAKVMEFLSRNNYFVAPVGNSAVADIDEATQERIRGYMEGFEMIYGVIVEEFGEELAPSVMDIAMDYLMGMAA